MLPINHIDQIIENEREQTAAKKMIAKHKKATGRKKLQSFRVPGDPCNTVFLTSRERGPKVVQKYIDEHKTFWL